MAAARVEERGEREASVGRVARARAGEERVRRWVFCSRLRASMRSVSGLLTKNDFFFARASAGT